MLARKAYLEKLIAKKDNGKVKVITGLRRSGKSVLLFQLYREYLLREDVPEGQIISLALDIFENVKYRNPMELDRFIRERITDKRSGTMFSLTKSSTFQKYQILMWMTRRQRLRSSMLFLASCKCPMWMFT